MIEATSDDELSQSPEEVFDFLAAVENQPLWNPEVHDVRQTTPGPSALGTKMTGDYTHVGRIDTEITEFDRPRTLELRSVGKQAEMLLRFELQPNNSGTLMHVDGRLSLKGPLRLMEGAIRGAVKEQLSSRARLVKQALDGRASTDA